jgi:hypothetical protein
MADNLDPEIQRQLNEQMQKMSDTVNSMVPAMVLMTAAMNEQIAVNKGATVSQKDGKKLVDDYLKSQKEATAATEAETKASREYEKAIQNLRVAGNQAAEGLGKLTSGLLTAGGGMTKYSGALDSAGDAAWSVGKAFGPLGMAIGGLIKVFGFLATQVFKQNENMLKASDSLAQMGVTGGITTKEILSLGQRAGYASGQLEEWTNIVKTLGPDITALGLSATEGTKAFGKLTEMDEKLLEGYRNLGVSQVALNKNQADYIKLQVRSGQEIDKRSLQDGSLRRASLEYTNNLLELSAFTGMEVEEIKKKQEVARADLAISTRLATMQDKEAMLRSKGMDAEADRVKTERENTMKLQDMAVALGMSGDEMAGFNSMLATGNFNELSAGFAAGTPGILEFIKNVKEGKKEPYELAKFMADATKKTRENVGEAIIQQKDIGKSFAYSKEMVELEAKMRGKTPDEIKKMMDEEKAKREAALRGEISDDAKAARNAQETAERRARLGADAIVGILNGPVTSAFTSLMKVMGALAKGIAHFAKWLGGPDFTDMFDTPEEVAAKLKDNTQALEETTKKIELTKKAMQEPEAYKEGLIKEKKLTEDAYIAKAQETEKIRELYSKEEDETKKSILKKQLTDARKAEQDAKEVADKAVLNIKNAKFAMSAEARERRIQDLEKQKVELLEKDKKLKTQQQTLGAGAPAAVAETRPATAPAAPAGPVAKSATVSTEGGGRSSADSRRVDMPGKTQTSQDQLADAGLKLKRGDVQAKGASLDPRMIELAKQVQAQVPNFVQFTGFNDQWHQEKSPSSKHTEGLAFDFTVGKKPTKEEGASIVAMLKELGADMAIDEYNNATAKATAGHFHAQLKAYDGGIFDGPTSGYNVELHGREAIVPLPDPSKSLMDDTSSDGKKSPLTDLVKDQSSSSSNSNSEMVAEMMAQLLDTFNTKMDEMIDKLGEGNDISDQLLKVSRV